MWGWRRRALVGFNGPGDLVGAAGRPRCLPAASFKKGFGRKGSCRTHPGRRLGQHLRALVAELGVRRVDVDPAEPALWRLMPARHAAAVEHGSGARGSPGRVEVPVVFCAAGGPGVDRADGRVAHGGLDLGLLRAFARDAGADLVAPGSSRVRGGRAGLGRVVAAVGDRAARIPVARVAADGAAVAEPELRARERESAAAGVSETQRRLEPAAAGVSASAPLGATHAALAVLTAELAVLVDSGAPARHRLDGGRVGRHRAAPRVQVLVHGVARPAGMPELAGGWGGSVRRNSTELAGLAAELAMELAGLVMELSQPEPSSMQPQGAPAGPWATS